MGNAFIEHVAWLAAYLYESNDARADAMVDKMNLCWAQMNDAERRLAELIAEKAGEIGLTICR